jgi:uncharacterized Fe-S cluster-containing protein
MLYKGPNNPMAVRFNNEPKIGIFVGEAEYKDYNLVLIDGQEWIVENKQVKKFKTKEEHVS